MQWSDWSPCFGRCSVKFQARNCSKGCVGDQNIEIRECSTHENCSGIMYSCSIDDYIYILYLYIVYTFRLTFQTKKTSQEKEEQKKSNNNNENKASRKLKQTNKNNPQPQATVISSFLFHFVSVNIFFSGLFSRISFLLLYACLASDSFHIFVLVA